MRRRLPFSTQALFCLLGLVGVVSGWVSCSSIDAGELKWRRQSNAASRKVQVAHNSHINEPSIGGDLSKRGIQRDANVVAATWDEEDARDAQALSETEGDAEQDLIANGPEMLELFSEDRLAQLPENDPFDEPVEEDVAETETEEIEPEINDIEESIEEEMERRQTEQDIFSDDVEKELFGEDPLEGLDKEDPFNEEDWLNDAIEKTEERLQNGPGFREGSAFEPVVENEKILREQLAREREENDKNCAEEIARIRESGIEAIDISIRVEGNPGEDFPYECALGNEKHQPRDWPLITYNWKASALCHKPLYFEQVRLERYGHSWGPLVQPIMSGVHFFGSVPVLPYKMGVRTPCECVYSLGYYRPGNCAPYMIEPVPLSLRGALFQTGAATGISFTIP